MRKNMDSDSQNFMPPKDIFIILRRFRNVKSFLQISDFFTGKIFKNGENVLANCLILS